jgi:hypothetical protein
MFQGNGLKLHILQNRRYRDRSMDGWSDFGRNAGLPMETTGFPAAVESLFESALFLDGTTIAEPASLRMTRGS